MVDPDPLSVTGVLLLLELVLTSPLPVMILPSSSLVFRLTLSTCEQFVINLIVLRRESSGYLGVQSIIVIGDSKQEPAEAGPHSYEGCRPTTGPGEQSQKRRWERHRADISSSQDLGILTSNIL